MEKVIERKCNQKVNGRMAIQQMDGTERDLRARLCVSDDIGVGLKVEADFVGARLFQLSADLKLDLRYFSLLSRTRSIIQSRSIGLSSRCHESF